MFRYRKSKMKATKGDLVLLQYDGRVVAIATFVEENNKKQGKY